MFWLQDNLGFSNMRKLSDFIRSSPYVSAHYNWFFIFSTLSTDIVILRDYIGILGTSRTIHCNCLQKGYSLLAQKTRLFTSVVSSLTSTSKYGYSYSRDGIFIFLFCCLYSLNFCLYQGLLSIPNVAEQHEVWDFLSDSSKVCICICWKHLVSMASVLTFIYLF